MYSNLLQVFTEKGVEEGVNACQTYPSLVLYGLRQGVLKHVFGKYRTEQVPGLEELAQQPQTPPLGLFTIGPWVNSIRHRNRDYSQWIAIDWELVIRRGAHYMCETGNLPSLAILGWELVREAAIRRFPPLAEILFRELIQACAGIYKVIYDSVKYPPLTKHEEMLKDTMMDILFKEDYVTRAIRRNFRDNFGEYSTEIMRLGTTVRDQLKVLYPSISKEFTVSHYLSVFSIARTRGISRKKLPGMVHKGFDQDPFLNLPSKNNLPLYELGHIYRLGSPTIDGVWRYKDTTHPLRPVKMLVIHMGKYAEYRTQAGCDTYSLILQDKGIQQKSMILAGVHFADWFRDRYSRIDVNSDYNHLASLASDKEIYDLTKVTPDDLWVVPQNDVKKLLTKARDASRGLERYRREPNRESEKGKKRPNSPKQHTFIVESPPITAMRNKPVHMQILRWYGRIYFSPVEWEVPIEQTWYTHKNGKYVSYKGVYSHPDLDSQFYTLAFLSKVRMGGIADYSQIYEWLNTFLHMSKNQLDYRRQKTQLIEKRLYYKTDTVSSNTLPYSPEEAAFIIDGYRPNMTEQQSKKLQELLPDRTWASIGRQALKLCKEMIDSGVTDYEKLPHRMKTDAMRIRIRKMKGKITRKQRAKDKK
jgi:hypothetical protein